MTLCDQVTARSQLPAPLAIRQSYYTSGEFRHVPKLSGRYGTPAKSSARGSAVLNSATKRTDQAKLNWPRRGSIRPPESGERIEFESMDDFDAYAGQIGNEVSAQIS